MIWLFTSSFKTANEIFAVPIQLLPSLPPRISSSPYIVEKAYRNIEKPEAVDETEWETLAPELTQVVWTQTKAHIAANAQLSQLCSVRGIRDGNSRGFMATTGGGFAR